ncbi:hypothetical protein PGT21_022032 [Puccinia graminis f. sp. tritici]|uniref:Uncharacterized protein n=1 Tax=Puccinia graminis f. sp. tritici TaxID=56615 RepID=A0A5B0QE41_PUCGR|nr:hypothetical protein PGT21_022032 [Puccinia graminis f. sp. tritici]KAA1111435.1 hypothetical protein PGTUg99_006426 [Puccinia graminis f. sp. tritici]
MDPHAQSAHNRIRLFLADLNFVLGSLSCATTFGQFGGIQPSFNQTALPSRLDQGVFHQPFLPNRSTKRSRAWKGNHRRCQPHHFQSSHRLPSVPPTVRYTRNHPLDRSVDQYSVRGQPNKQYQAPLPTFVADHPFAKGVEHNETSFNGPEDGQDVHDESSLGNNLNNEYPSDCNDQDDECPSNLYEHNDDQPRQEQASETASDNNDPEVLPEITPTANDHQVPDPTFSMDNYSARDVDRWARTLSADQFEQLRILGPASRIESFRQYAITNLDQPTLTLTQQTSSTHDHLEQPLTTPIGLQYTSNKSHYQPDNINNNDFDQQQLHPRDNNFGSNLYNHFDEYTSQMEENLDGLEAVDANSGFDDGGYNNCGFDDGRSDDGGFDNGGFDNGGFDDGGFDNGGFDGGFDDGYGSTY